MKQATEILRFALTKIDDFKIQGAARWMIYLFVVLLMCCIALFIIGWIFTWKNTGIISLGDMSAFIGEITSVSFVAAIGFFGKALVDKDGDGIPDEFEK
ncbi:MAG: hypothetical protein J6N51_03275 [Selenomonas sp.]|nr:hypothetical protein [Selenomonas sp.]